MPTRFLVAPDSFKGTFDAPTVAGALAGGLEKAGAEAERCPVADGGEGTAAILVERLGGEWRKATVPGPLGDPVEAQLGLIEDGGTAVLDVAEAAGLGLVEAERRDPEAASTRGAGELIRAAIAAGARRVLVGAGGSATTDGGAGAIEAIDARGGPGGAAIVVLCDTRAPFEQAARIFAPQKGAGEAAVERLTERLDELAERLPRDPRGLPMGGAGGGLSGGLWAAFDAELRSGSEFVLDAVGFDDRLGAADEAITGEGRVDAQSLEGKIVGEIARRCTQAGKPLHVVAGENGLDPESPAKLGAASIETATTLEEVEAAAERIAARPGAQELRPR